MCTGKIDVIEIHSTNLKELGLYLFCFFSITNHKSNQTTVECGHVPETKKGRKIILLHFCRTLTMDTTIQTSSMEEWFRKRFSHQWKIGWAEISHNKTEWKKLKGSFKKMLRWKQLSRHKPKKFDGRWMIKSQCLVALSVH